MDLLPADETVVLSAFSDHLDREVCIGWTCRNLLTITNVLYGLCLLIDSECAARERADTYQQKNYFSFVRRLDWER